MAATRGGAGRPVASLLACATASLLGQTGEAAEVYGNDWSVDAAYLAYSEKDRVDVTSYITNVRGSLSDTDDIKLGVVLDTMTGATPTGAVETSSVTTVTGTSGGGFSASGEAQALTDFDDARLAVDVEWTHELERTLRIRPNGYVSVESDYEALGGGITVEKDTASKQTTFSFALGGSMDTISQVDGTTPVPTSDVEDQSFAAAGKRDTLDTVLGLTRIINPNTVAQVNLFYSFSEGYHTDPYKVVSVANDNDVELRRIYESRPTERERSGVFTSWTHELPEHPHTIAWDYRYYTDDWGVESHTVNTRYRFDLRGPGAFVEPFGRYYSQTEADFYVRNLEIGEPAPALVSADNRLADSRSLTLGVVWGLPLGRNGMLKLRGFRFEQRFDDAVFGENTANVIQVTYTKDFY